MHFSDIRNAKKIKYITSVNKVYLRRVFAELIVKTNYQAKYLQYLSILRVAIIHLTPIHENAYLYAETFVTPDRVAQVPEQRDSEGT